MGGVRVLFRITNRISIIRPWSCFTALLVLIGLPGFWLFALGFWLVAGPGFAHWLSTFLLTMVLMGTAIFVFAVALTIQPIRKIQREQKADAAARALADAALRRRYGLKT